jgi:L-threonylcarbamoyladenylate synthase
MLVDYNEALTALKKGDLVAIPTETVYGLGADALNPDAVSKIYDLKKRPRDNPLICHFYSIDQIKDFAINIPKYFEVLIRNFSPGPVTYLLNLKSNSGIESTRAGNIKEFTARIPSHQLCLQLIKDLGHPIAAPSANTSGEPSPTTALMVENDLGDRLKVLDGGPCDIGLESSIIDCTNENIIRVLRPGSIGKIEIEKVLKTNGIVDITVDELHNKNVQESKSVTPGMKYRHYSPQTPLIKCLSAKTNDSNTVIITCLENINLYKALYPGTKWINLGSKFDTEQLAHNLYLCLRQIDELGVDKAYWLDFEFDTSSSIGKALKNRLDKVFGE